MKSPILQKEIEQTLDKNPKIREALRLFKISEEQYAKAIQSLKPSTTTSNTATIFTDCEPS
jgi:outer membrane protein TolC